jgi:hypothetical protein
LETLDQLKWRSLKSSSLKYREEAQVKKRWKSKKWLYLPTLKYKDKVQINLHKKKQLLKKLLLLKGNNHQKKKKLLIKQLSVNSVINTIKILKTQVNTISIFGENVNLFHRNS